MRDVQYKPQFYWDFREARWVRCAAPEPVAVPEQPAAVEDQLPTAAEADTPAG